MSHAVVVRWQNRLVRLRPVLLLVVFAAGLALPVVALSQTTGDPAQTTTSTTTNDLAQMQALFRQAVLDDSHTTSAVRGLLQSGAGFIDPATQFGDITGDGKADAVVRIDTGGAAGAVAAYVLTSDGSSSSKLRIVFRNQQLYRVTARIENGAVVLTEAKYARGDEPCCASKKVQRTYAWDATTRTLKRTSSTEIAGPGAPTPPQR